MDGSTKDPRCAYVAQTAAALFGVHQLAAQIAAAPEVSKFLNEINTKVLQIMSDGQAFRCLVNQVANPPQGTLECHFIKTSKDEIKAETVVQQLLVSTIRGSSVLALHSYISTIYTPILFGDVEEGSKQNAQLRDLLYSLKAGLQRTIRKGGQTMAATEYNEEDVKGILSPTDEIELWLENERENYSSQQNENLRKKAELINQHFSRTSKGFYDLETMELGQISAFTNQVQDALDQIWQDPKIHPVYSQTRMENMFKIISKSLGTRIEIEFQKNDVWQSSFSDVRVKLNECMRIFKGWKDRVTELTREFWKGQSVQHQWKGKPFSDPYLDNMIIRVNEIFELRSQHDELLRLLSPEEQKRLNVDSTFNPFRKINSFYTNEYQAQNWTKAKAEYEKILEPMEKEICQKLRKEIFTEKLTPSQLLREFQRWKGLLSKDSIKKELQTERDSLLVQLSGDVRKTKEEFEARTGQSLEQIPGMEKPPQTNNVSDVISAIVWSRQLSQKTQSNQKVAQSLFGDLPSMQRLDQECKDICQHIKEYEDGLFSKWHNTILKAINDPDPNQKQKFQMSGQLMEFDYEAGGLLKVNYSDKLVTLVKDSRMLSEMGFKVHKDIIQVTENAKKFYKEGVTLKQVANFYNSMGTQMIECQKPMMLDKAQGFEYIIRNPKGKKSDDGKTVTWQDPIEIETYIKQVQNKATELISENRRLRKVHITIIDMIVELMNIDLLKNKNTWKENLAKIRKMIEQTTNSRGLDTCKLWITHLNYQLYKALEHQYQMGLESLNESLPEIQCDLVFRNKSLELRPTFEELKQKYYKEITSFITTPLRFQGFAGGRTEIFKTMPERNSKHLNTVYIKAEELFQKLTEVKTAYLPWTVLGTIDLQAYIEQNFKTVDDWENNFQMLKTKRKELKKLPDSVKVDCINVNLVPFKGGVEDIFKRLSDALVETLQTSIEKDAEEVYKFIKAGLAKLNSNPQSVEEIEKMHSDAMQLQVDKDDTVKLFEQCEKKNLMIKQMTGQSMGLSDLESMWREFDARINAFNDKIEDQKDRLRKEIDARIKELNSDLEKMFERWQEKKPKERNDLTREEALETAEMMKELRQQWSGLQERIQKIQRDCEHFKKERPKFTYYDKLKEELNEQEESWSLFEEFNKQLNEFGKEDWITYRKKSFFAFQDFFTTWIEKLKSKNKDVVNRFLLSEVDSFSKAWSLIKLCVGESFEREHWKRLITLLEMPKEITLDNMKFKHLIDAVPLMLKKSKDIKELSDKAQGEVTIREAIRELRAWCDSAEFVLTDYDNNGRRTPLIKEWKEIITQVSDNQSLMLSLKESRYFQGFADQVEQFEKKLGGVDEYLSKLNIIQRKWVYLEPIFMRGALPQEQGRFRRVDEEYRGIMLGIGANPKVVSLCEIPGLKDTLETILTQLDMCQKALNDFLEQKRSIFSRFYFIGDDDLLEILGQAKNPVVIQSHLKKLFAGIYKVEFDQKNGTIISMISQANEYVPLRMPVKITDDVEVWLGELEKSMRDTLNALLQKTIKSQGLDIVNTPSQICCLAEMIGFSDNCAKAVKSGKLANYKQDLQRQLESYTSFDNKGDLLLFSKVKSLILDIIHNIDVVEQLTKDPIMQSMNINDWMWFKQLKYYIEVKQNEQCKVGMCDAFFDYTFEYQGNAPKLVHTPLTDKCYLTLVLGMKMGYGGNPYGPAGTGKTESVKALGQAFGRQVLVFNCDEGLDYKAMGRIFIGLVKCGAWGCFDEFNRLLEEQLSAISQQIQVIQWAIKEAQPSLELLGRRIEVNKNAGIFVTMNPAGKHYGGRSKLPDNLKQLFRPVAMSVPDNELIAETLLFSEGFKHAKKLSNKIVSLFKLCRQLLSEQQHYDWGLRALKTILNTGGQLCQNELKKGQKLTYDQEALLLIKAIRINTMSKLTYSDSKKYEALQSDMFPGIKSEDIAYEQLTVAIKSALEELKLEYIESQIQKILQFYEATRQRMGCVIVGPSGCGKTTIWKILKLAYEKMNQNIVTHIMNPKSMPRNQLLGLMNHDTREFNDGVLTASARAVVKEPAETLCWIVCDGDIDPEWVESLNSVLDDNHLLTLPNGERISFGNNINFIFETNDLKFASPATVSRLGMIFLSDEDVDVQRITKTWIKRQDEKFQSRIQQWLDDIFYKALDWTLHRQDQMVVETTKIGIVKNALSYMINLQFKGQFVDAVIRGLGGNFPLQLRALFAQEVFNISGEKPVDPKNLLQNYFDEKTQNWMTFVQDAKSDVKIDDLKNPESPPIVKTINIQRDINLIKPWLDQGDSFILVGPEGSGKNLMIRNLIKTMKSTQIAIIHCNSQTSAFHVIQKLNQMCSQSTISQGRVYRPKDSQRLILYLKDINLPKPDKYDTIQLIAFLQQIVCYKGFYDDNLEFVYLERVQIVASMNPSTTIGRHRISSRFTANVRIAYIEYPTSEELLPVYAEFMKTIFSHPSFGGQLANSSKKLSQFLIELFSNIKNNFSIDEHRHYLFTPRDITQLIFSLLRYDIRDAQSLVEVLIYESSRIFKDRLVDKQSKAKFDSILYQLLRNHLKYQDKLVDTYFISKVGSGGERIIQNLPPLGRIAKADFITMIEQSMRAYEREFKEMNIHLFDDILELIAFTERTLSKPGGCLLMAGRSGVGRKTTTQLVAHMLNMSFFSPNINREYGMKEFKRDLKIVLQQAGIEAQKVCLLIEDHHIIKGEFLEYLNSLISAGEVPGLYTPEELEPILSQLQEEMRNQYECRTLFEFFVSRIQKNLSIVISMDYSHPKFLHHCSSNPALYTKCTILWNEGWSKESMIHVSRKELQEVLGQMNKGKDEIVQAAINIQLSSQELGASPLKYLNFIQNFRNLYTKISSTSGGQSKHLMAGIQKLEDAARLVDELSRKAEKQKVLLKQKQIEAAQAMKMITASLEEKGKRKQEIEQLQQQCSKDEEYINVRKVDVEQELSGVQPEVDAAKAAVGQLNSSNINEIKAYKMPPDAVSDVLQGVLRLMGQDDTSWNAMKKFLGQTGVVQSILNFDARLVSKDIRKKVNKLIQEKPMSFEQSVIQGVSRACAPLAAWVKANVKYSEALLKIEPLTNELGALMNQLEKSQYRMNECVKALQELDGSVQTLNENFAQKTQEAESLKFDLKKAEDTLFAAQSLLSQLSGENERWKKQIILLEQELALVPVKSLLSSAYITYLGQANESTREKVLHEWLSMIRLNEFNFRTFLSTESQLLTWKKEGLPADTLSMENAIMILNSNRTPLIIDPATQATEWLKQSIKKSNDSGVEILNHQDPKFNTTLELSIRFGKVLIILEVDGIESMLFPVLRKDLIQQGPRQVVQIGEKAVDYNPNFKMFLCTRDQFVDIPPNAQALITTVNFTVTKSGLEGQLLSITINFEQPELESRKTQLLEQEEQFKIKLASFEKMLLDELANSEGNILENKSLIDSLNQTKQQSTQIETALEESKKLQLSLDQQRNVYRTFANIGSNLFMVIGDLIKINNMYQFSLASFIKLFKRSLETKPQANSIEEKLNHLSNSLIRLSFSEIGRSLFKSDRLTYSLHFIKGVYPLLFGRNEWEFFSGSVVASADSHMQLPKWATKDRKEIFAMFANTFSNIVGNLSLENDGIWQPFMKSNQPEKDFPQQVVSRVTPFQRCLIIQVFRPDRLESAMHNFVKEAFGGQTIQPAPFALAHLFEMESSPQDPILFIISPGSDPSAELQEFAEQVVGRAGYHEIAMGGGQNEIAIETIKQAAVKGEWVCLKNLHLVTPWLPSLEKEFKMLHPHQRFRLWLTSEPHTKFPSILLQSSLKITYETPPGVRNNLMRTFQYVAPTQGQQLELAKTQLLFVLSWFHALIQERRTYIPQGWTKYYEFSYGDLKAGEAVILDLKNDGNTAGIQWQKVYGILENAIYGGRIDNEYDLRVLRTYMYQIFKDETIKGQKKLSDVLVVPQSQQVRDFNVIINQVPEIDTPQLFGLPSNIDRSVQRFNSLNVINQLKSLGAISAGEMRFDKEKWSQQLGPICQLWSTLFKSEEYSQIKISQGQLSSPDPVDAFVYMEMLAVIDILRKVDDTIQSISRVLQGVEMLTPVTEKVALELLKGEVPLVWIQIWEGPANPNQWLRAVCKKAYSLRGWLQRVQQQQLLTRPVNLSDLIHPETFLNALRQKSARLLKHAIDEMKLVSSFEPNKINPQAGVQLDGLWLQGCDFDGAKLNEIRDTSGSSSEIIHLPACHIAWIRREDPEPYQSGTVNVPVYHALDREKLLCTFNVPNNGEDWKRIIGGVALFLNGSEA